MTKLFQASIYFILLLMFITLGYFSYQVLYPFKTIVVNDATTNQSEIKAGDLLNYTVDYCKYTDKPAVVYRTFHSIDEATLIPFPSVSTITVPGCHVASIPLQTFATIPPGSYYLLVDAEFKVNPQRNIHVIFKTNTFKIINKTGIDSIGS